MDGKSVADDAGIARYLPELRAAAERLTKSADEAEDLLQDCLASAVPGLAGVRDVEVLGAWLRQILRRRWYDRLRRRAIERRAQRESRPVPPAEPDARDPELVRRALGALDPSAREILELRFFRAKTSVEIGRKLGRPAGTVRSMIFHALQKFEAEYGQLCSEENV